MKYIPQPDDTERVWVTIWQNNIPRTEQMSRGLMRRVRLWAIDKRLDIIIEEN